jgi:hypothetical protein
VLVDEGEVGEEVDREDWERAVYSPRDTALAYIFTASAGYPVCMSIWPDRTRAGIFVGESVSARISKDNAPKSS